MSKLATIRPAEFVKPAHWTNDPAPAPKPATQPEGEPGVPDPTRYGDWVRNGIAVDF
jgi:hypothetical protein